MKISKNLKHLPLIRVSKIQDLQGNLKDLDQANFDKLKLRIENHGFKYPMYLWKNKGKFYNLDGNQRQRVIQKAWGDIEVPYIEIEAKDEKEAKKEILAISSQYGKVTKEGFDEFAFDFELEDWAEVEMETTFDGWMDKIVVDGEEIEIDEIYEPAEELGIEKEYLMIVFETQDQHKEAIDKLGLQIQREVNNKKIELNNVGIQRVMKYEDLCAVIK